MVVLMMRLCYIKLFAIFWLPRAASRCGSDPRRLLRSARSQPEREDTREAILDATQERGASPQEKLEALFDYFREIVHRGK